MTRPPVVTLHPFNFTPRTRTPWGGTDIARVKEGLLSRYPGADLPPCIGESWEVSTDASFPSLLSTGMPLQHWIARDPASVLGGNAFSRFGPHSPLLVKLLSANDLLSVQVHPPDGHRGLAPGECGKPEAWLVLCAEPQGFVYLGFREGWSQEEITQCLQSQDAGACLHRVYPQELDYISVPPGCVHAVGTGVLLAEPQRVLAGKEGKTWRLFDWNRRFSPQGEASPEGKPRALHVQEALSCIDWSLPRGRALEERLLRRAVPGRILPPTPDNPFALSVLEGPGTLTCGPLLAGTFQTLTVWQGAARLHQEGAREEPLQAGESAFVPAATEWFTLHMAAGFRGARFALELG